MITILRFKVLSAIFFGSLILNCHGSEKDKKDLKAKEDSSKSCQMQVKTKVSDVSLASDVSLTRKQLVELIKDPSKFPDLVLPQDAWVTAVAINKQKTLIASGDYNGLTYIRDFKIGKIKTILFCDNPKMIVRCIKFHPTKNEVIVGYAIYKDTLEQLKRSKSFVLSINDVHIPVTVPCKPQYLVYYDLDNYKQFNIEGHTDWVNDLDFSPDGSMFATISDDFWVKVWNTQSKQLVHQHKRHINYGRSISFSADSGFLASAGFDGKVVIYDISAGKVVVDQVENKQSKNSRIPECPFLNFTHPAVARFHPINPNILVTVAEDNTIAITNLDTRKATRTQVPMSLKDKDGTYYDWIASIVFNEDGSKLACTHNHGGLTILDLKNDKKSDTTFTSMRRALISMPHWYGSIALADNVLYVGYEQYDVNNPATAQQIAAGKLPQGFVFKWNTDINHGKS
jgi:WD40 repeat protein